MPTLKPVGHQSTKLIVLLVLSVYTPKEASFGIISPLKLSAQAMNFPNLGSHFAIKLAGSNTCLVISTVLNLSKYAFSGVTIGA